MKKTNLQEIKELDAKAIWLKIVSAKQELRDLILDKNMNKLKDTSVMRKKKQDIAQMLTVLNQKKLLDKLEQQAAKLKPEGKEETKGSAKKTQK